MKDYHILAINFNHDGSGTILSNGKVKAFVNTERFSKKKKHPGMRRADLEELLDQAGIGLRDIGIALLCNAHIMDSPDIPRLYGSHLKETWFDFWINKTLDKVLIDNIEIPCMVNPDHHLLHCALSFYSSPFEEAIAFSWDPTGYGVFACRHNKMEKLDYSLQPHNSCGWYAGVATELFDTGIIGAGKVMGLAPYGSPGTIGDKTIRDITDLDELFELSSREDDHILVEANGRQLNATLAYNIQALMEMQLRDVLYDLHKICEKRGMPANVCLGGGGTLNSVANQVAFRQSKFERIFMHPASGDDGTAIGAAMWFWFDRLNNERMIFKNCEIMYSVRCYEDCIDKALELPEYRGLLEIERAEDYIEKAAQYIADDKIIAWYQGASEVGPRALGNRSILADPRNVDMKDILNSRVKFREAFRPFAPSVMNEHAEEWFGLKDSPFMLRVCNVLRDGIPAVRHVDETARIQTVSAEDNSAFHRLINCFYNITGVPLLINTSFNIKGESIVETPQDAINCLLRTDLDYLVFRNIIVKKASVKR